MKHFCSSLLLILYCFATLKANSTSLILLNETDLDTKFEVWINGVPQTYEPHNKVKITKVPTPFCEVKVVFEEEQLGAIEQKIYVKPHMEYVYMVELDSVNGHHLCYEKEQRGKPIGILSYGRGTTEVKIGKKKLSLRLFKYNDTQVDSLVHVKDETASEVAERKGEKKGKKKKRPSKLKAKEKNIAKKEEEELFTAMVNKVGKTLKEVPKWCEKPIENDKLTTLLKEIEGEKFENKKKQLAKQVITCNCLSFRQLAKVMRLFKFDRTRLELACFAYYFVSDPSKTKDIHSAFEFASSIKKWKKYIAKTK